MRFSRGRIDCRLLMVLGVVLGEIATAASDSGLDVQEWDPTRPDLAASDLFRQRVFGRADGLPSDTILALRLARDGALWIGTGAGLARYDGESFRTYDHVSHPEFVSDEVRAVDEGPDGRLWVGTADGLLEFRGGKAVRRWTEADGLVDGSVHVVEACRDGSVWFGTRRALHRIRAGQVESWPDLFTADSDGGVVGEILEDRDGRIHVCPLSIPKWTSSKGTALSFDNDRTVLEWKDPSLFVVGGSGLIEDDSGRIWGFGGSICRQDGKWTSVTAPEALSRPKGWMLMVDRQGVFWSSDWDDGLIACRGGRFRRFTPRDGLSATPVRAMVEDREGNLWIGTESGLNRWQPRRWPVVGMAGGLPEENVWTLAAGRSGEVWLGTDRGVRRLRTDGSVDRPVTNLVHPSVRSLHVDRAGTLWIGTGDSLESWRDGVHAVHRWETEVTMNKVRVITSDAYDRLWVGRQRGLMCRVHGEWRRHTTADGLPMDDVRALRVDQHGNLWVGTFGGGVAVLRLEDPAANPLPDRGWSVLARFDRQDGLPSGHVWAFLEDQAGTMWAGTERGLARFTLSPTSSPVLSGVIGRREGLHYEAINEILSDDADGIWLGTDRGIARVTRSDLHAVADGRTESLDCVVYSTSDGLPSAETNGQKSQPAGLEASDGSLWFPTTRGVARVEPAKVRARATPVPAVLERVVADGNALFESGPGAPVEEVPHWRLLPGRGRVLEVAFDAVSFRDPRDVRFRHRLQGVDRDWVEAGDRRVCFYTGLRPGRYRFEVQASVNHGLWSRPTAGFTLELPPRLHQSTAFRIAVLLAGCGLLVGLVRWRERERERLADLRRQVDLALERQRIARDMHDDLGAGLTRLVLLGDHARREAPPGAAPVFPALERVGGEAARLVDQLGELVWATNPDFDELAALVSRLREHAAGFLEDAELEAVLDFPEPATIPDHPIPGTLRKGLSMAFKEALTNAVRHAGARKVGVTCRVSADRIDLAIEDDGRGFEAREVAPTRPGTGGQGLVGIRRRLEQLRGEVEIRSESGRGTRVSFSVPLGPS